MTHEIIIDSEARTCRVITGAARRTFFSTPQAVAVALLAADSRLDSDEAAVSSTNIHWTDMLATHGIAVGSRGRQVLTLAVLPAKARTLTYTPQTDPLTRTFPPILLGMLMENGNFVRGNVMVADTSRQTTFGIHSPTPVLAPFPYGNIYENGRICWGSVPTTSIHNIADFEALFFGSGFNTDLFLPNIAGIRSLGAAVPNGVLPAIPTAQFTFTFPRVIEFLLRRG